MLRKEPACLTHHVKRSDSSSNSSLVLSAVCVAPRIKLGISPLNRRPKERCFSSRKRCRDFNVPVLPAFYFHRDNLLALRDYVVDLSGRTLCFPHPVVEVRRFVPCAVIVIQQMLPDELLGYRTVVHEAQVFASEDRADSGAGRST